MTVPAQTPAVRAPVQLKRKETPMVQVTEQAMKAQALRTGQDMVLLQNSRNWERTVVRVSYRILAAVCLIPVILFAGISFAQEKDTILPGSGIVYPGGYDLNTVGEIKGKVGGIVVPESGPVQLTLIVDKETYIVLASPGWHWKDMDANITGGTEVSVRGSKSVGKDGKLYIIAQELKVAGSKKTLALRSETGKALWSSGSQAGRTGSQGGGFGSQSGGSGSSSGGFGSSSGSRVGGSSSGKGKGGR
jgi:hypothetical protein